MEDAWLIVKRDLYYRPQGQGYTGIRDNAGRYTHEEALAHHNPESGESIVRLADAPEFTKSCWDDVARKHLQGKIDRLRAAARGGNADKTTAELLEWVADRLVHVHGENPNVDYVRACRERAAMLRDALNFSPDPQ